MFVVYGYGVWFAGCVGVKICAVFASLVATCGLLISALCRRIVCGLMTWWVVLVCGFGGGHGCTRLVSFAFLFMVGLGLAIRLVFPLIFKLAGGWGLFLRV